MHSAIAPKPISVPIMCGLLRLADIVAVLGSAAVAYALWLTDAPDIDVRQYAVAAAFAALLAINLFHLCNAYEFEVLS